jgi:hypothetical protein
MGGGGGRGRPKSKCSRDDFGRMEVMGAKGLVGGKGEVGERAMRKPVGREAVGRASVLVRDERLRRSMEGRGPNLGFGLSNEEKSKDEPKRLSIDSRLDWAVDGRGLFAECTESALGFEGTDRKSCFSSLEVSKFLDWGLIGLSEIMDAALI